jgi:hypothetical protein
MKLLSEYCEGTKSAKVYAKKFGGYQIILIDSYEQTLEDRFADTEDDAEDIAEDWVSR